MSAAIDSVEGVWDEAAWRDEVEQARGELLALHTRVLVTVLDNSPRFIALDEAASSLGIVHVPLPLFFSHQQIESALAQVGADTVCLASSNAPRGTPPLRAIPQSQRTAGLLRPDGTAKITFTSGTTGTPKGVCLSQAAMESVAQGLVSVMQPLGIKRHLSALPYAVLLENVAGVLAARRQGATVITRPLAQIGLRGSSDFDARALDHAVRQHEAESLIVLPQMLKTWISYLMHSRQRAPTSLKFVAVGGAAIGQSWLTQAQKLGMPAYEGYGLSEGASVQTLNLPWASRDGSVGRALPHCRLRSSKHGEIEISGSLFLGYLGATTSPPDRQAWFPTGDLGRIDQDGFVFIEGRLKNVLITSYGRNVSPEWVETALMQEAALPVTVVVGDSQAHLSAVVWTAATAEQIEAAIVRVNAGLPDYARVHRWVQLRPDQRHGFFTPNGRPLRAAIESHFVQENHHEPLLSVAQ